MKKIIAVLIAFVLCTALLYSCGEDKDKSDSDTTEKAVEITADPSQDTSANTADAAESDVVDTDTAAVTDNSSDAADQGAANYDPGVVTSSPENNNAGSDNNSQGQSQPDEEVTTSRGTNASAETEELPFPLDEYELPFISG